MGLLDRFRAWIWRAEEKSNRLEYGALDRLHRAEDRLDEATHGRFYDTLERADEEAGELLEPVEEEALRERRRLGWGQRRTQASLDLPGHRRLGHNGQRHAPGHRTVRGGWGSCGKLRMSVVLHWWSATTKCQSRGLAGAREVSTSSW
jgi:hypothetical protein